MKSKNKNRIISFEGVNGENEAIHELINWRVFL